MTEEGVPEEEEPRRRRPDTTLALLFVIAGALLLIGVMAGVVFFQWPAGPGTVIPPARINSTGADPGITPGQVAGGSTAVPASVVTQHPVIAVPTPGPTVGFRLSSGQPTTCGLTCRQLNATLTNTGEITAHHVCISLSMHNSRNDTIRLNGETVFVHCIGDLAGGTSRTGPIIIDADCGVFATLCYGETLTLQTTVTSDERTIRFPDQLIAVG